MAWPEIPPEVLERDRELGRALWLLSAPFIAARTGRHVDLERRRVEWEGPGPSAGARTRWRWWGRPGWARRRGC